MDDRAKKLLKTLVERYIADGQPVGSRTLSKASGLDLSPATIRNVMADLEDLGLIASPHTSAGRIPTARGYRLFVDTMLTAQPLRLGGGAGGLETQPLAADQPQRVIANAAQLLSSLSNFVGVITAPRKTSVFHHIEFMRLSERRVLVILVGARRRRAEPRHLHVAGLHAGAADRSQQLPDRALRRADARTGARTAGHRSRRVAQRDRQPDAGRDAGRQRRDGRQPGAGRHQRRAQLADGAGLFRATSVRCASCSTCSSRRRS